MLLTNETKTHFLTSFRTGLEEVFGFSFYSHHLSDQCVLFNTYRTRTNDIEEIVESKAAICLFIFEEGIKIIELHTMKSFVKKKYETFLKSLCAPFFKGKDAFLFFYSPSHSFFHLFGDHNKRENLDDFIQTLKKEFNVVYTTNFSLTAFFAREFNFLHNFSSSLLRMEYSSHMYPLYVHWEEGFTRASFVFWVNDRCIPFYNGVLHEEILTYFKEHKINEESLLRTEEALVSYTNTYLSFEEREPLERSYVQKGYLFEGENLFSFISYYLVEGIPRYTVSFEGDFFESDVLAETEAFVKEKLDAFFKPRRLRYLFQQKKKSSN